MHIVFVCFHRDKQYPINELIKSLDDSNQFSVVQRGTKDSQKENCFFVKDDFDTELRWWQNPEKLNKQIAKLNPDLVYIFGLNLPLHFRWLRHYIPPETPILAQHGSEDIWIQKNLWLQQFGLRVVNGFVFDSNKDAEPWLKCAAILESQPIYKLSTLSKDINNIFSALLNQK